MLPDLDSISMLLEAVVVGFSVLGGFMAAVSGYLAAQAHRSGQSPESLTREINRGIAVGFEIGANAAFLAAILVLGMP